MGSRIKELREKRGIKQKTLADQIGTSQQTISRIEKDQYKAPTDLLVNIAKYFHVTVDYLLELSDAKRNPEEIGRMNRNIDEYYDIIEVYGELNRPNRKTAEILLRRLREAQEEIGQQ